MALTRLYAQMLWRGRVSALVENARETAVAERRSATAVDDSHARGLENDITDGQVPLLCQAQYRFLRFLFEMADALDDEDPQPGAKGDRPLERRLQRSPEIARMRTAVWLFEQSDSSPAGGPEAE